MGRRRLDLTRPVVFPSWVRMIGLVLAGVLFGAWAAVLSVIPTAFIFNKTQPYWSQILHDLVFLTGLDDVVMLLGLAPFLSCAHWVSLLTIQWQGRTGTPFRPARQLLLSILWVGFWVALHTSIYRLCGGFVPDGAELLLLSSWFLSWNLWWAYDVIRRERAMAANGPPPT